MVSGSNSNRRESGDANFNVVLGLPVPKAVQLLPRVPPVCYAREGDRTAVELLRSLGARQKRPENEIARACDLAYGISDVAIILERPRARRYDVMFEEFVQASDTLRSLDALIRFSTRGALSIHTVTVLDAFSFQENRDCTDFDLDCHQTLAQIIRVKKPKVIIRCHRDTYLDEWMGRFELPGEEYRLVRQDVEIGDGHVVTAFQSFHMSCAVQNANYRPEFRALLIHHFVAAFGELRGHGQLPDYVEDLRALCNQKGDRVKKPFNTKYMAARYTCQALSERYNDSNKPYPIIMADLNRLEQTEDRALAFYSMYQGLKLLAQGKCNPGSLALGRTKFFNWAEFFRLTPLFEQITWLLNARGTDQRSWISTQLDAKYTETRLSLEKILKALRSQQCTPAQEDLTELRRQLVASIKERTLTAERYLHDTTVGDLTESLNFASTVAFYGEFIKGFDTDGYILEGGQVGLRMDVLFCQRYLRELDRFLSRRPEAAPLQDDDKVINPKKRFIIRRHVRRVDAERE